VAGVQALPELAAVPWRQPTDARWLRRWGRIWHAWTLLYTVPFIAAAVGMVWLEPLATPVALAALAHAWIIPELYAFRGASVLRPKTRGSAAQQAAGGARCAATAVAQAAGGARCAATDLPGERVAQGLLGDLLGHEERELQRDTGLALERGALGLWLVGERGALLVTPGRRRVHCFCVAATDPELPPSDRIAHLLLALRVDEEGFATVANHAFAGASWRVRRRLPQPMRPALDAARRAAE
jgi:hypothetical protein